MVRTRFLALGLSLAIVAAVAAADPLNPTPKTIAITGALIRTQTEAGDFVGTIIIRDGKIAAAHMIVSAFGLVVGYSPRRMSIVAAARRERLHDVSPALPERLSFSVIVGDV